MFVLLSRFWSSGLFLKKSGVGCVDAATSGLVCMLPRRTVGG